MTNYVEQLLLDKRNQFEDEYGDIIVWFKYEKNLDSWYILMMDKKNQNRYIERFLPNILIKYANLDILWYEFDSMRRRLMK